MTVEDSVFMLVEFESGLIYNNSVNRGSYLYSEK